MSKVKRGAGNDAKFFSNNKKGENQELREELRSPQRDRKRDAVKKVIANMTVGKDVSSLFMDVINCIQTDNLELKKLVYLYLINYAKSQPEQAILAVNTFVKDANDPNPLIRALAIRTMGCIRVEKITEYLCEPLSRCLKDEDPYVRKTAAVCTAKLYDISPELVEERGFLDILQDLISDSNPTVVSNAVAALGEISETSGKDILVMTSGVLQKLLAALNECSEWGQIFILDSLSHYIPQDTKEAEGIIERVSPRLQHSNSAVVMSAVKIILKYMEEITNEDTIRALQKKLAPPLISLLSNPEPEIQYVALRNINLIVLKRPKILDHEIKVFFCKYNDPIYVKMEKLEIIIRLASEKNIDQVLLELKEYSTEVDVEFVRKAVRAIGRCAIKLERSTERCISVLLDLIKTKVNYVVQEAIIVIKDIFRKYPNKYENIIANLCENLEDLDEPEAKAAMVWIIGEYAERIENADDLLESFLESFQEETAQVQLQLLTAIVKLFLKQPDNSQEIVKKVLNLATEESDNPDLRDRGYFYWRLLSTDPEAARVVVLSEKPEIGDDNGGLEQNLLDDLIGQIASLASIYHKPAEAFIMKSLHLSALPEDDNEDNEDDNQDNDDVLDISQPSNAKVVASNNVPSNNLLDFFDNDDDEQQPASQNTTSLVKYPVLVTSEAGQGLFISGAVVKNLGKLSLELEIGNSTSIPVTNLAIQFNKNAFAVVPQNPQITLSSPIVSGSVQHASIQLVNNPNFLNTNEISLNLQAAMKNIQTNAVFYFLIPNTLDTLFVKSPPLEIGNLVSTWKSIDDSLEVSTLVNDLKTVDQEVIKNKLNAQDVSYVTTREIPGQAGQIAVFFSARAVNSYLFIIELKFKAGLNICKITVKSQNKIYSEFCKTAIAKIIA